MLFAAYSASPDPHKREEIHRQLFGYNQDDLDMLARVLGEIQQLIPAGRSRSSRRKRVEGSLTRGGHGRTVPIVVRAARLERPLRRRVERRAEFTCATAGTAPEPCMRMATKRAIQP